MDKNTLTSPQHRLNISAGLLNFPSKNRIVLLGVKTLVWHWIADSGLFAAASSTACHFIYDLAKADDGWDSAYLKRAFRPWDVRLAEWFEAHCQPRQKNTLNELVAQFRAAARRSGKGVVMLYNIENLFAECGKEEVLSFFAATMEYAWYVLIGDTLDEKDIPDTLNPHRVDSAYYSIGAQELRVYYACTGIALSDTLVGEMDNLVDGWTLAAAALNKYIRHGEPVKSTDIDVAITGWYQELDEQLFDRMELHERYVAILLCDLDSFTSELASYVCPYAEAVLNSTLEKLPGVRYAKRGTEYTIHPLIRRYWLAKRNYAPKKLRDSAKVRAATYFLKEQKHESALLCALGAANYKLACNILKDANVHQHFHASEKYAAHLAGLDRQVLYNHPMLWAYQVVIHFTANQYDTAHTELLALESRLFAACNTAEEKQAKGETLILRAFLDLGSPQAKKYLMAASEILPRCVEIWDGSRNDFISNSAVLVFDPSTGTTLQEACHHFHEIAPHLYKALNNWGRGFAHLATAECAYLVGDTSLLIESANKALTEAIAYQQWDVACLANYYQLDQYLMLGQTEDVLSLWRSTRAYAKRKKNIGKVIDDMANTSVFLATKQWYFLPDWVRNEQAFRARALSYRPGREYYARTLYLLVKGENSKALRLVNEALGHIKFSNEWVLEIRLKNIKLVALCRIGESEQARALMMENYWAAEEHGVLYHFSEQRTLMLEALRYIQRLQQKNPQKEFPPTEWIERVAEATQKSINNANKFEAEYYAQLPTPSGVRLTPIEYRALQLLCLGVSRSAMAKEMRVSHNYMNAVLNRVRKKLKVTDLDGAVLLGRAVQMHDSDALNSI